MQTLASYLNGQWFMPSGRILPVYNPAHASLITELALGSPDDAHQALQTAKRAFPACAQTTLAERISYLEAAYAYHQDLADAIRLEMDAPARFALNAQAE